MRNAFFKAVLRFREPAQPEQRPTLFKGIVPNNGCKCFFGTWRDNQVCDMHLKAGRGKYVRTV